METNRRRSVKANDHGIPIIPWLELQLVSAPAGETVMPVGPAAKSKSKKKAVQAE
jgi:hypothetical protein